MQTLLAVTVSEAGVASKVTAHFAFLALWDPTEWMMVLCPTIATEPGDGEPPRRSKAQTPMELFCSERMSFSGHSGGHFSSWRDLTEKEKERKSTLCPQLRWESLIQGGSHGRQKPSNSREKESQNRILHFLKDNIPRGQQVQNSACLMARSGQLSLNLTKEHG